MLPGTHSKWVQVADGRIEHFTTCMTGEFYALLRQHSILARAMPAADGDLDEAAFQRGVQHAQRAANLLHAAFSARTLALFDQLPAQALPSYLSGIVIGEELRTQLPKLDSATVTLIGNDGLTHRYALALQGLGIRANRIGTQASWRGLWTLAGLLEGKQT